MKKLYDMISALVVVFVFSASLASTAFAEATLLAEWLIKGNALTSLTSIETNGELLVSDTRYKIMALCSWTFVGSVGPDGGGEITSVFALGGDIVTSLSNLWLCMVQEGCEITPLANVSPEALPWHTLLFLDETSGLFLNALFSAGAYLKCNILGIPVEEECITPTTSAGGSVFQLVNAAAGVEYSLGPASPNGNCTLGGAGTLEQEFEDGTITEALNGELLSVSE